MTDQMESRVDWGRRTTIAIGLVALILVAGLLASVTVPRWWAHRIGDQVDGSITQGTTLGLVYGFVFTFLPIIAIVLILRWRRTWKTIAAALAIGILLALPNLMTLSIVVGSGSAAHAGDRVLDVEAPAFRGGSLVGAVVAVLARPPHGLPRRFAQACGPERQTRPQAIPRRRRQRLRDAAEPRARRGP